MRFCFVLACLLLFQSFICYSLDENSKFSFNFEMRHRFESWSGMNSRNYAYEGENAIGSLNDKILFQRIITGVDYRLNEQLLFSFHIQDSRAFGWSLRHSQYPDLFKHSCPETGEYYIMNPNEQFFEIHDAYIEYDNFINNFSAKLGRQKIFYGDNRIFGPGNWGNTGRWTWDALKVSYAKNKNFVDVFAGGTKIHNPVKTSIPFTNTRFWGWGMYSNFRLPYKIDIQPFYAYKTQGSAPYINTLDINRHWLGTRLVNENFYSFLLDITAVKQLGNNGNSPIDAYGFVFKLGYNFENIYAQPQLSVRHTYASGGSSEDVNRNFEPVYGANDSYYGRMNLVSWSNIDNREILLELFPTEKMWIEIKYNRYYFNCTDISPVLNTIIFKDNKNFFGDELGIFITYEVSDKIGLTASAAQFMPGDIKLIAGKKPENATWFALQSLISF